MTRGHGVPRVPLACQPHVGPVFGRVRGTGSSLQLPPGLWGLSPSSRHGDTSSWELLPRGQAGGAAPGMMRATSKALGEGRLVAWRGFSSPLAMLEGFWTLMGPVLLPEHPERPLPRGLRWGWRCPRTPGTEGSPLSCSMAPACHTMRQRRCGTTLGAQGAGAVIPGDPAIFSLCL